MKDAIIHSPGFGLFDPSLGVIITTDASGYGIGSTMTRINRDGVEVTTACVRQGN